jgi:hypothetical protein
MVAFRGPGRSEQEMSREHRRELCETGSRNQVSSGKVVIGFPFKLDRAAAGCPGDAYGNN